jgi:membrane-associated protein
MDLVREFFAKLRNLEELIKWGGYPVLMFIIFAETGLLVGFFLPGDSLLVTAGVLINADLVNPLGLSPLANLALLNVVLFVMAVSGDAVGFLFGAKAGPKLFNREQSLLFRRDHLLATKAFYDKHGGKTIIMARFMPFARTFAPIVAGIGQMPYARFAMYNVVGGFLWVFSMSVLGFFLGQVLGAKQIERVVYLIILISVLPPVVGYLRSRKASKAEPPAA